MKRMKALSVVEWHLTSRQAIYYLLSIGMPTAFYLFFSGMYQDTPGDFMRDYLLSMTAFSMMSTAIFSFPTVLETDRLNNWQKVLRHTPVSMVEYYLIKVVGLVVDFLLSIVVVFTVGHVVRHVNMPLQDWVLGAFLLILGSLAFVAIGLVLTLLPSSPVSYTHLADVNPIRTATTRAKAVQASGHIYYWDTDEPGAFEALLPLSLIHIFCIFIIMFSRFLSYQGFRPYCSIFTAHFCPFF